MATVNYIFGAPGTGKTCYLAKLCKYYTKKGIRCFSNFPLKGAYLINDNQVGYFSFKNSVLLLDECGISYDSRGFSDKNGMFKDKMRLQYWKLARHYGVTIWCASQGWDDIDKKIKTLSTNYIHIRKSILPFFTLCRPIVKKCEIDEETHQPMDYFVITPFLRWRLLFRPAYYKYFDSFDAPPLPEMPQRIEKIGEKEDVSEEKSEDE